MRQSTKYYYGTWDYYLDNYIVKMGKAGYSYQEAEDIIRKLHTVGLVVDEPKNSLLPYDASCYDRTAD